MKTKKISEQITYWLGVVAVGLIFGLSLQFVQAWTEPSVAPPGGNVGAPLNTSNIGQTKAGGLMLNTGGGADYGLIVDDAGNSNKGRVGIGTTNPGSNKLEVVGGITKTTGGLIIETRTDDPASPQDGRLWLRTDL